MIDLFCPDRWLLLNDAECEFDCDITRLELPFVWCELAEVLYALSSIPTVAFIHLLIVCHTSPTEKRTTRTPAQTPMPRSIPVCRMFRCNFIGLTYHPWKPDYLGFHFDSTVKAW